MKKGCNPHPFIISFQIVISLHLHPILSRKMHAVHRQALLLHLLDDGLAHGDGSFLVHIETGTVFGVFQLKGYAVHDVAGYELVV